MLRKKHEGVTFRPISKLGQTNQPNIRPTDDPANQTINHQTDMGVHESYTSNNLSKIYGGSKQ